MRETKLGQFPDSLFLETQNEKGPGGHDPTLATNTDFWYETRCTAGVCQGQGHLIFSGHREAARLWSHTVTVGYCFSIWIGPRILCPICDTGLPRMSDCVKEK